MGLDIHMNKTITPPEVYYEAYDKVREKYKAKKFIEDAVNAEISQLFWEQLGFRDEKGFEPTIPETCYNCSQMSNATEHLTLNIMRIVKYLKEKKTQPEQLMQVFKDNPEKQQHIKKWYESNGRAIADLIRFFDTAYGIATELVGPPDEETWEWVGTEPTDEVVIYKWFRHGVVPTGYFQDNDYDQVLSRFRNWVRTQLRRKLDLFQVQKALLDFPSSLIEDFTRWMTYEERKLFTSGYRSVENWLDRSNEIDVILARYATDTTGSMFGLYKFQLEKDFENAMEEVNYFRPEKLGEKPGTGWMGLWAELDYFMLPVDPRCQELFVSSRHERVTALFMKLIEFIFAERLQKVKENMAERFGSPDKICNIAIYGQPRDDRNYFDNELLYWRKDYDLVEKLEEIWSDSPRFFHIGRNALYSESVYYPAAIYLGLEDDSFQRLKMFDVWKNWRNDYIGIDPPKTKKEAFERVSEKRRKWNKAEAWLKASPDNYLLVVLSP